MDTIYTKDLTIRFSETDNRGKFSVVSIFNCFQDVGSEHAFTLGLSAWHLLKKNYTWVMLKYNVRINQLPGWNETVTIKTWRYPLRNLYELRQFDILDAKGNLLISGLSSWVMMNFDSRKPVRLDRFISPDLMENQTPVDDDFSRLSPFDDSDLEKRFNVRMQDIDFNNHVNNSVYIGWAVETVPQDVYATCTLKQVEVTYVGEIAYGHTIYAKIKDVAEQDPDTRTFFHQIEGGEERRELTRLKTVWGR
jgi:medium-chain acyl-[acyl-carrier-protein] hydrolase